MVLLLQARPSMTAAELAEELEVSERTVARDAQALSEAGIPVYADRGRAGGYRLIGGYRTRLTGLARTEAEALFLSGIPGALREMGLQDAASAARLKVSAALAPGLRDAPASAAQRFHLDAPGWWQEPATPALLPEIAAAVWDDRPVRVRYRRRDAEVERELEPYGLVLKAGVWYLCARAAGPGSGEPGEPALHGDPRSAGAADGFRVYRVDRLTAVTASGEPFARDESFDLPAFWSARAASFARSVLRAEAVVRLTRAGIHLLPMFADRAAAAEALERAGAPDGQGRVTVNLPVESAEVACTQLLALGPEAEVLAPAELRDRMAEAAGRMSALYRAGPASATP